jgi:hypothetical protein
MTHTLHFPLSAKDFSETGSGKKMKKFLNPD